MKFNIGDKVRFLNDVGGGKVIKYVDDKTVLILNDDDFEIPVLENELIKEQTFDYEHINNNRTSQSNEVIIKEEEVYYEKDTDEIEILLALVSGNNEKKLFIINDSNFSCFANVALEFGAFHISYAHLIAANTKIELRTLSKSDISAIDSITVQLIFYKNKAYKLKPVVSKIINTSSFNSAPTADNDFFDEKAIIISIFDETESKQTDFPAISAEEIKKAMLTKEVENKQLNKRPRLKSSKPKEIREVDLHIHELIENQSDMTPKEMLDYQMECFRKEMRKAIDDRVKQIVFIHGKGNGSLRSELRMELKHKYRKYQFQDASFQNYGFGATMVYLNK